ncbi:MAG: glycosyltransferase family 39 protein [candidate division Zixibacteria bacterium]|nr:glycosyltransferase family 39 protein [candidate division Zixibacteria bacterium]
MRLLIDLLFVSLYCLALGGLGVVFFKKILKIEIDFFTGFFAGCGIAIVILFSAGMLGMLSYTFIIVFVILIFIFTIFGRRSLSKEKISANLPVILPLILVALVLVIAGLSSLSPPIKNDTLYYHLGLPKLWLADSGIKFYPTIAFSATALSSEVLLMPVMSLRSPGAAQFFVYMIGVMIMFLLAKGFRRFTGGHGALAFIALGAVPLFIGELADAKNDFLAAGFALAATLFYLEYIESNHSKSIILAGVFIGLSVSTKSNAIIFAIAMFLIIAFSKHRFKDILVFIGAALVFGLPWYVKAFIETGNPFYPFYDAIFHSPYWRDIFDPYNKATFVAMEHKSILNFITSPFRLVYDADIFRGRLGPVLIIFLPLMIFIRPIPKIIRQVLLISAVFFVIWYVTWPNARYMMPIIPLLSFTAAYIIDRLYKMSRINGLIILAALSLIIALTGVQVFRDGKNRIKAAVGIIGQDQFLATQTVLNPNSLQSAEKNLALPYYNIWQFLNEISSPNEKVGILCSSWFRADGFYLNNRYYYLTPTEQAVYDFSGDRNLLEQSIKDNPLDYILLDYDVVKEFSSGSEFSEAPGFDIFSQNVSSLVEIVKQNGRLIYSADRFELYKVKE